MSLVVLVVALILLGEGLLVVAGQLAEFRRTPMTAERQASALGRMAALPSGRTHIRWDGPDGGPVLVCVHGLSTPSEVFDPLVQRLTAQGCRVLRYDLYGRGFSDRARGCQTTRFFLTQLIELLDAEGVTGPVPLVGYSMGGAIVTNFAAAYPERTASIALIAPAGFRHRLGSLYSLCAALPLFGDALWSLRAGPMLRRTGPVGELVQLPALMARETSMRGYLPALLSSYRYFLSVELDGIHSAVGAGGTPVLALWGAADPVIPLSGRDRLALANADAKQITLEDADHGLPFTHPEEVTAALTDWLGRTHRT